MIDLVDGYTPEKEIKDYWWNQHRQISNNEKDYQENNIINLSDSAGNKE